MALKLEVLNYCSGKWQEIGRANPGDRPGSLSDVRGNERQVYMFECIKDNSCSKIYKSRAGIDIADRQIRLISSEGMDLLKRLTAEESYVIQVKTDHSPEERKIRFTHLAQ